MTKRILTAAMNGPHVGHYGNFKALKQHIVNEFIFASFSFLPLLFFSSHILLSYDLWRVTGAAVPGEY